jgi:hypothetical protein
MHIVPAHLQGKSHQVRPMRAPAQILGGFIGSGFTAATSANERAAPDAILTGSLSADGRDEWRAARHNDGVSILTNFWNKSGIEGMDAVRKISVNQRLLRFCRFLPSRIMAVGTKLPGKTPLQRKRSI